MTFCPVGKVAQQALTQARNLGLLRLQLEASLTLGQVEMQAKNPATARIRLQTLAPVTGQVRSDRGRASTQLVGDWWCFAHPF
jgi:hypothetical protein